MAKWLAQVFTATLMLAVLHLGSAQGQHMYLDVNGDSESTAADTLGNTGTFRIGVWLTTNRNRAGEATSCATGADLTVNSYEIILRSDGGSVRWDDYENDQAGMTTALERRSAGSDFHFGHAGGEVLSPGKHRLGTVTLTVSSGTPSVTIVPGTPLGATFRTSFGSSCPSADDDNTMELGVDWYDVGGAAAGHGYGGQQPQSLSTGGDGHFFLGGNEIPGPWTLTRARGVVSANGLTFPPPAVIPPALTEAELDQDRFLRRVGVLADSLNRAGVEASVGARLLAQFCASNRVGASVEERGTSVRLRLRDGSDIAIQMGLIRKTVPNATPVPRKEMEYGKLQQVAQLLRTGCVVFVVDQATTVVIPSSRREEAIRAVAKLRAGMSLSVDERRLLPERVQAQVRAPVPVVSMGVN